MKTGREAAAAALLQMEQQQAYSHLLSANGFSLPDPRERAFGRALFWGVLERMLTLDAILAPCLSKPLSKQDPAVRCLLRLGAYQLYYTRVPDNAAVYETVELAKKMGRSRQSGFINGVLRQLIRGGKQIPYPKEDPLVYDSLFYSCPLWLVRMWHRQYGQQAARQMLSASIGAAPLYGRVNTLRIQPKALVELLAEQGLSAVSVGAEETRAPGERAPLADCLLFPDPAGVPECEAMKQGLFHIQDTASQLCAAALDPKPGERVVDVCAAPGGKSFTLAQRMEDQGELYAFDLYPQRAELIRSGAERLGLTAVRPGVRDALNPQESLLGSAHRVLCDVVCSGLGTIRRKPEIKYKPSSQLDELPKLQYDILEQSARYVRPGGVLVYSTCTLNRKENQGVTEKFLREHPEFVPDPIPHTEGYGLLGTLCPGASPEGKRPPVYEATLLPGMSDGFYLCRMKRRQ